MGYDSVRVNSGFEFTLGESISDVGSVIGGSVIGPSHSIQVSDIGSILSGLIMTSRD